MTMPALYVGATEPDGSHAPDGTVTRVTRGGLGSASLVPGLTEDEDRMLAALDTMIRDAEGDLDLLDAYYNSTQRIEDLGISIPPQLSDLRTVIGWPMVYVDALEERLDVEGFRFPDDARGDDDLWTVWQANNLDEESQLAHVDALVFGRSYITIGSPDPEETEDDIPVITVESPRDMAVLWNPRTRRTEAALRLFESAGEKRATLYLPEQTISLTRGAGGRRSWTVDDRDRHGLGVVPVVRMSNRQRVSDRVGSSEITKPIMSLTDSCCRTLLGMEVAREFYSAPQRWVVGAAEGQFRDAQGRPLAGWEAMLGRVMALGVNDEGHNPEVGTFSAYDPATFTRVVDSYAHLMASQTGLPLAYLGVSTDQPASADAIRMQEQRHVKKAERKQRAFGGAWEIAMRLALRLRDGRDDDASRRLTTLWRDAATPTLATQVDAATKLITAGVLPATSSVAMDMVGLSVGQQQRIVVEREAAAADAGVNALLALPSGAAGESSAAGLRGGAPASAPAAGAGGAASAPASGGTVTRGGLGIPGNTTG
jgi:hypothetical protein